MILKASTLRKIRQQTDINDHGGALLTLAKALGCESLALQIAAINQRQEVLGHLPSHLASEREELAKQLMLEARRYLSEASYQALYDAF